VKEINEQGADYLYCDETTFKENDINKMLTMHFKPDYAPDNLRANNYICHFSVFSRKLLEGEELFRTAFDGAQDHDTIQRLTDRAEKIVHVPRLMYYWRSHEGSTAASIDAKPYAIEAAKGAVADPTLQILNVILIGDHDGDLRISQDLIPDPEDRGAGNSTTPEIKDYYSQLLGLSGDDSYEERCKLHTVCPYWRSRWRSSDLPGSDTGSGRSWRRLWYW